MASRLVSHRNDSPVENSLAAFEYALSQGCDGFEFDVRQSRDGRNVLWHDPDWKGKEIAVTDYADLSDRDGCHVACLEDVLKQFGQRAYLDIELKVAGNEESVVAALCARPPQRGFIVSSFLREVLVRVHEIDGRLPLGYICDRGDRMDPWRQLPIRVFLPRHDFVSKRLIEESHRLGRQLMTWTVNSERQMRQLGVWGVDGLISDDPQLLCRTFHTG
jgi:glycerophosphoryl diester phosphodiesterase